MSEAEQLQLIEFMERKVEEIKQAQSGWKKWVLTTVVILFVAMVGGGSKIVSSLGSVGTKQEIIWKEYVPGDMFKDIVHSWDMQNKYIINKMEGNLDGAEEVIKEFREYRDKRYEDSYNTRSPAEGRTEIPQ